MIDLDRFKQINDELGHEAGDAVLVSVAQSMRSVVRVGDAVGRWGGEEFLAILPNADAAAALRIAERLRAEIEQHPPLVNGASVTVTVGGAVWTGGTIGRLDRPRRCRAVPGQTGRPQHRPADRRRRTAARLRTDAATVRCGPGVAGRLDANDVQSSASRARSSAGERSLHTREVAGSKPAVPIST